MTPINDSKQDKLGTRQGQSQHYIFRVILVETTFYKPTKRKKVKRASEIDNTILALAAFK